MLACSPMIQLGGTKASPIYHRLPEEVPVDGDLPLKPPSICRRVILLFCLSVLMLLLSILLLIATFTHAPSDLECAKRLSPWSSMWDAVEFWEGDLTNNFNHSSIYRGPPTPEREQAWEELWHYPGMPVSDAGIAALNKTHQGGEHIQIVDSDPSNPTYGSIVEVFHQLHCLNMIRQYTWFLLGNYDRNDDSIIYPWDFEDPVGGRMHVDHCFEALRLDLMCYGDITPVLIEYDEHRAVGRTADFSVHHKCRNFDKIVDWVKENGVEIAFAPGTDLNDKKSRD